MSREWQPGDVAMVAHRLYEDDATLTWNVRILRADGKWYGADGWVANVPDAAREIRPLVVIDPDNREDVARVQDACWRGGNLDDWQDYLRNLADPKPPRPEEPTGLGAVVEDGEGQHWIRCFPSGIRGSVWRKSGDHKGYQAAVTLYGDIGAVRILSPGYDPEATS